LPFKRDPKKWMSLSETLMLEQGDGAGWRCEEKSLLWREVFDGAKYPSGQSVAFPCFELINSEPSLCHETLYLLAFLSP
jgi:hypothetical protein